MKQQTDSQTKWYDIGQKQLRIKFKKTQGEHETN